MMLFALVAALLLQKDERETMARDGIGRARSAISAVDAHLRGVVFGLRTLAASKNLETGNIAAFHAEAQRVLKNDSAWVNIGLIHKDQVLFNAVYAFGKPEPRPVLDDSVQVTAEGTKVSYGSVRPGNVVRSPTVRVHLPVSYGQDHYIIAAPLNMKLLVDVLSAQNLPESWTITLMDRERHVIASVPPMATGSAAPDSMRTALEQGPEGWARSATADLPGVYYAHVTSDLSGWMLAIGIPTSYMEAGARRSFAVLAIGSLIALALGIGLAWVVARRLPA
jgi:hypothetical protein